MYHSQRVTGTKADVYVYQWSGYPTMIYDVPIDSYDHRISLQTLMRRVARGCLHFIQASLPLILPSRSFHLRRSDSLAVSRFTQIASSSTPSRKLPWAHGNQLSLSSKRIDPFGSSILRPPRWRNSAPNHGLLPLPSSLQHLFTPNHRATIRNARYIHICSERVPVAE